MRSSKKRRVVHPIVGVGMSHVFQETVPTDHVVARDSVRNVGRSCWGIAGAANTRLTPTDSPGSLEA
jgi:hypothetical protein